MGCTVQRLQPSVLGLRRPAEFDWTVLYSLESTAVPVPILMSSALAVCALMSCTVAACIPYTTVVQCPSGRWLITHQCNTAGGRAH